jgi:hypothetical protein
MQMLEAKSKQSNAIIAWLPESANNLGSSPEDGYSVHL